MANLTYKCPHCGATHEIDDSLVGGKVDCRQCKRPFEPAIPLSSAVEGNDEGASSSRFRVGAGQGDIEDTLVHVHPAMIRQAPFRFVLAVVLLVVGFFAVLAGTILHATLLPQISGMFLWVSGLVLMGAIGVYLGVWWISTRVSSLTVTEERTIYRRGLISKKTSEVRHRDIRNLQIDQGILDRIFGVGQLKISSAGQDDHEIVISGIPDPERIAAVIRDLEE